jgi:hypothetical protein
MVDAALGIREKEVGKRANGCVRFPVVYAPALPGPGRGSELLQEVL